VSWLLDVQQVYLLTSLTFVAGLGVFLVSSDWFNGFVMFKLLEKTILITHKLTVCLDNAALVSCSNYFIYFIHLSDGLCLLSWAVLDQKKLQNKLNLLIK